MASMILATDPTRRIIETSPDLAESLGTPAKSLGGVDCAGVVRCRNAYGKPLCHDLCPALMAGRSKSGVAQELPVWLEKPTGELQRYDATFQRIGTLPNGMVVAFFGDPAGGAAEPVPAALEEQRLERGGLTVLIGGTRRQPVGG